MRESMPSQTATAKTTYPGIYRLPNGKYLACFRSDGPIPSETCTSFEKVRKWHRDTLSDLENKGKVTVDGQAIDADQAERIAKKKAGPQCQAT